MPDDVDSAFRNKKHPTPSSVSVSETDTLSGDGSFFIRELNRIDHAHMQAICSAFDCLTEGVIDRETFTGVVLGVAVMHHEDVRALVHRIKRMEG